MYLCSVSKTNSDPDRKTFLVHIEWTGLWPALLPYAWPQHSTQKKFPASCAASFHWLTRSGCFTLRSESENSLAAGILLGCAITVTSVQLLDNVRQGRIYAAFALSVRCLVVDFMSGPIHPVKQIDLSLLTAAAAPLHSMITQFKLKLRLVYVRTKHESCKNKSDSRAAEPVRTAQGLCTAFLQVYRS